MAAVCQYPFPYVLILFAYCGKNLIVMRQTPKIPKQPSAMLQRQEKSLRLCNTSRSTPCWKVTTYHRRRRPLGGKIQNPNAG